MEALTLRDIKEKLHSLFGEDNRLVFWYDGEGDFEDTVDTLVPDDVTVLRLTDHNAFRAKLRLEHEDPDGRYLIYAPFTKPDVRQNVLEDMLLYSKKFYADQLSWKPPKSWLPGSRTMKIAQSRRNSAWRHCRLLPYWGWPSCCLTIRWNWVVSRFFRKFISSASKYRNQIYGFSSSFGCSISILNRCSMSI